MPTTCNTSKARSFEMLRVFMIENLRYPKNESLKVKNFPENSFQYGNETENSNHMID